MPYKRESINRSLYQQFTLLVCFVLGAYIPFTHADSLIVLSRQLVSYQTVADTIASDLKSPSRIITLEELKLSNYDTSDYQQIIALGSKAGDKLFDVIPDHKNLFISFLPRQTYESILEKHSHHNRITNGKVTAIYLDQPYARQLALARLISPNAQSIATALGPHSSNDLPLLKKAAKDHQLKLKYATLKETDNPIHKLQPLIRGADLFLSLPDKSVFNRTTAKWILYISFRQRIPLIGFSRKYVDAGALAAVYSTPEDIGHQTAQTIRLYATNKRLPPPAYSNHFRVATNETAANSLRITIPSEAMLTEQLMELKK